MSCGDFRDILFPLTLRLHSCSDGSATGRLEPNSREARSQPCSNGVQMG